MKNSIIEFLASYGPQPSSNNLYDEFVTETANRTKCSPIKITLQLEEYLTNILQSKSPKTVILTGTAGDGKTFTARQLAEKLSPKQSTWTNTEKVFELERSLKAGNKLMIIKDLSELNERDKDEIFPSIRSSLNGEGSDIFIICVNDGQLLRFLRTRDAALHNEIRDMMHEDTETNLKNNFYLINMSHRSEGHLLTSVIDSVVDHPNWSGCVGCSAYSDLQPSCPIRINLEILRKTGSGSMRDRLTELITIAAGDGRYLPIRQLILLTINILLGDRKKGSTLLTCRKARDRAQHSDYWATNPYANVFGDNLSRVNRSRYAAFTVLSEFHIGYETNNYFDCGLIWKENTLPECAHYGDRIFSAMRDSYCTNPSDHALEFRNSMVNQRRRLFFSLEDTRDDEEFDQRRNPWNLTIFAHGADYIRMVTNPTQDEKRLPEDVWRQLLKGLNRFMTREMTTTDDEVWITTPSGVYMGQEVPLLVDVALTPSFARSGGLVVSFPEQTGLIKPHTLRIALNMKEGWQENLALRPTLVECLLRMADGALPSSFPAEIRMEIERFQLRVAANIDNATYREVTIGGGPLLAKEIPVMRSVGKWR